MNNYKPGTIVLAQKPHDNNNTITKCDNVQKYFKPGADYPSPTQLMLIQNVNS